LFTVYLVSNITPLVARGSPAAAKKEEQMESVDLKRQSSKEPEITA
jgi:hypothetical protein